MRIFKFFLLVFIFSLVLGCSKVRQKEIMTPMIAVDSVYSGSTEDDVQKAIIYACSNRGWKIENKTNTQIDASIIVRNRHHVAVNIPYSQKEVKIVYKESTNMLYKPGDKPRIHRNYNTWVNYLAEDIKKYLTNIANTRVVKK